MPKLPITYDWPYVEKHISSGAKALIVLLCLSKTSSYQVGKFLEKCHVLKDKQIARQYINNLRKAGLILEVGKGERGKILLKTNVKGIYGAFAEKLQLAEDEKLRLTEEEKKLLIEIIERTGPYFAEGVIQLFKKAVKPEHLKHPKTFRKKYNLDELGIFPSKFNLESYLVLPLIFSLLSVQTSPLLLIEHGILNSDQKEILNVFKLPENEREWIKNNQANITRLIIKILLRTIRDLLGSASVILIEKFMIQKRK